MNWPKADGRQNVMRITGNRTVLIAILLSVLPEFLISGEEPVWSVETLVSRSLAHESSLAALRAEGRIASSALRAARAERLPVIGIALSSSYLSDPLLSVSRGALGTFPTPPFPPGTILPSDDIDVWGRPNDFRYDITATIKQPVFTWGKIESGITAAESVVNSAGWKILSHEQQLRSAVLSAMESLSLIEMMSGLADRQEELGRRLTDLTRENFQAGFLLEAEYRDTRDRLQQIVVSRSALKDERGRILVKLAEITGLANLELASLELPPVDLSLASYLLPDVEILVDGVSTENPDLKQLEAGVGYAASRLEMARGGRSIKPDMGFIAEFTYSGGYGRSPDDLDGSWQLSLAAQSTLFDFGRSRLKIEQARGALEAARARYRAGRGQLETEVRSAIYRMNLNRENIDYYEELAETDRLRSLDKKASWVEGYGREDEWLLAEIDRLASEMLRLKEIALFLKEYREIEQLAGLLS